MEAVHKKERGLWMSAGIHALLLGSALVAYSSPQTFPETQEAIAVEMITDNALSQITKGERSAKEVTPVARPRAERMAEAEVQRDPGEAKQDNPAPPSRPAEMKVDDKPIEAAAAAPPPVLAPPPAKTADVKPPKEQAPSKEELAKQIEQQRADAEAVLQAAKVKAEQEKARQERIKQAKAKAEEDAREKAEEKAAEEKRLADAKAKALAEAKAKAIADAKAKAEAKAVADAKLKAEAEARAQRQAQLANQFNSGDIQKLLQSKEPAQSTGSTAREVNRTASLGTATGSAQKLNPSQRDALIGLLQDQLHKCWSVPVALQSAQKPPRPSVRIKLNQDGSLMNEPVVVNSSSDPLFGMAADSATRAARRCSPLRIPAQFAPYYQDWKDLVVNFDLSDMG